MLKGMKASKEARRKMSLAQMGNKKGLGKKCSDETKKKISEANKGKKRSKIARKKMSLSQIGRKHSEETKKKIGRSCKGNTNVKGHKLSKEHKKKISIALKGKKHSEEATKNMMRGKNHYNWKGGITTKNEKIRGSIEYKLWRRSVFEKDSFICQKYGISGVVLNVHHINNFADFPELRLVIDNGITLSKKAHKEFHKIYGKRNNTKEQLLEFLNN